MRFSFGFLLICILGLTACKQNDLLGKKAVQSLTSRGASPTPPPIFPGPSATPPGTSGPQAIIINNSPVFVARSSVGYEVSYSSSTDSYSASPNTAVDFDRYSSAAPIQHNEGKLLKNKDIDVRVDRAGQITRVSADANGNFKFSTIDNSKSDRIDRQHRFGQVMAYYWIDRQKETVNQSLANAWAPTGEGIQVFSYCADAEFNAYFDSSNNLVCMGFVGPFEAAYDASVYNHEMGHANIYYASQGAMDFNINDDVCGTSPNDYYCCPSAAGCSGAINEGQADVHSYFMFNSPSLGEYFMNDIRGLKGRNAEENKNLTAESRFKDGSFGKEIHRMGGVWGAAWYWLKKQIGSPAVERIFYGHLHLLSGSDDFNTALEAILTTNKALLSSGKISRSFENDILSVFQRFGIRPSTRVFISMGDSVMPENIGARLTASEKEQSQMTRLISSLKQAVMSLVESVANFFKRN